MLKYHRPWCIRRDRSRLGSHHRPRGVLPQLVRREAHLRERRQAYAHLRVRVHARVRHKVSPQERPLPVPCPWWVHRLPHAVSVCRSPRRYNGSRERRACSNCASLRVDSTGCPSHIHFRIIQPIACLYRSECRGTCGGTETPGHHCACGLYDRQGRHRWDEVSSAEIVRIRWCSASTFTAHDP